MTATDQLPWRPGDPLLVAVVGLLSSHPGSDLTELSRLAEGLGSELRVTLTDDTAAVDAFTARFPRVRLASLDEALAARPHVTIVTLPSPDVPAAVAAALASGSVVWVNKPASVHAGDLAELDAAVSAAPTRFLTGSILRFAPGAPPRLDAGSLVAVRATIRHGVAHWSGSDSLQDGRRTGGGLVGTMGLHGFELFAHAVGPGFKVIDVATSRRGLPGVTSEDVAIVTVRWPDGLLGTIEVFGETTADTYAFTALRPDGDTTWTLPDGQADPHGGAGAMRAVLSMAQGAPSPLPWGESLAVLRALADAVRLAEAGRVRRQTSS